MRRVWRTTQPLDCAAPRLSVPLERLTQADVVLTPRQPPKERKGPRVRLAEEIDTVVGVEIQFEWLATAPIEFQHDLAPPRLDAEALALPRPNRADLDAVDQNLVPTKLVVPAPLLPLKRDRGDPSTLLLWSTVIGAKPCDRYGGSFLPW